MFAFQSEQDIRRVIDVVRTVEGGRPPDRGRSGRQSVDSGLAIVIGKTDSAHNKSASGTISVWDGTASASLSDTGSNITAYNRFANVDSGKWVVIVLFRFGWEIVAAEC
jgi:hypothetical protein